MSTERYYEEYWSRVDPSPLRDPLAATRLRLLKEELRRAGAHRVLDVGCGTGGAAAALEAAGLEAAGFDISPRAVELAREAHPNCSFETQSVEELPWPTAPQSLDAVFAFEVIEHLLEPRRLLEGAFDSLRRGGHLALTTPYHGRLKNFALVAVAFEKHFAVDGDHIRFFTDRELRRLLDETGFTVERVKHIGRVSGFWADVFVWARKR